MAHTVEIDLDGRIITLETGKIAKQANGAVVVRSGDSVVLVSACAAHEAKVGASFSPLTVDYREYPYAAGKFPGGFIKREGRPSEKEILPSRMIDRPIRPLFPEGFQHETQVIAMVLSADPERDPSTLAMIGAAAALAISDIPFHHTLAAVRVALVNGKLIANPSYAESRDAKLGIVVAGTEQGIVMVEAGALQVTEAQVLDAIEYGHECCKKIATGIRELTAKAGKKKKEFAAPEVNEETYAKIEAAIRVELTDAMDTGKYDKLESYSRIHDAKKKTVEAFQEEEQAEAKDLFDRLKERIFRDQMLKDHKRPDGRKFDEIRNIDSEVDVLPTISPPFSVGEVGFMRGPGRREIGHGALAERSISAVLPDEKAFPYTLRVVSDILESNGSSSMATVCGATLALMDAAVPITTPIAGIAMGLVKEGDAYAILTDIAGAEDHYGDMDFKVAGSKEGITGLQMDIKVPNVTMSILTEALEQARRARLFILDKMAAVVAPPRGR